MSPTAPLDKRQSHLANKLGSQVFELKRSIDPFSPADVDTKLLGHILFESSTPGSICVDGVFVSDTYWNDASHSVGWVSSIAGFCEGHLSFTEDCKDAVGTVLGVDGQRIIVTGHAIHPSSLINNVGEAPPSYAPSMFNTNVAFGSATSAFAEAPMMMATSSPSTSPSPEVDIHVLVYKTFRRPGGSKQDDDWVPWYNFAYGTEIDDVLSVVCYVNDIDISALTTMVESENAFTLVKAEGDAHVKKLDYTFRIALTGGGDGANRAFTGSWVEGDKSFEWKGEFIFDQQRTRKSTTGPVYGPDGKSTLQQLLVMTSLSHEGKDIAQAEADRIFGRIILQSVPEDVKKKLYTDIPTLDNEEKEIQSSAPDFLARAGVVNIMSHLQSSPDVPAAQRNCINKVKCDAFFAACAAVERPDNKLGDPVETFEWDRVRDKDIIQKVQTQYRDAALKCYRLGYVRSVHSFRPYLKDAKFWYKRFAERLQSPVHIKEVVLRQKSKDSRLEADVQSWIAKLTMLQEAAGDVGDAPTIQDVIGVLQGASALASLDMMEWNDEFSTKLNEFFKKLDDYGRDPAAKKDAEYSHLQKLMAQGEGATWSKVGAAILEVIKEHGKLLHRKPTLAELSALIAEKEAEGTVKGWPKAFDIIKSFIRPAIIGVGLTVLSKVLFKALQGSVELSTSEQVSIYASLVRGVMKSPSVVTLPLQTVTIGVQYLARAIGRAFEKLLPERALAFINAAKAFSSTKIEAAVGVVKSLWETWGESIKQLFGFFVSVAVLWVNASDFKDKLKDGTTADKWFAGTQLVIAALNTVVAAVELGATIVGEAAAGVVALAGTLGIVLAGIGVVVAIVALIVTLSLREDPVKDFIDNYGSMYDLLK